MLVSGSVNPSPAQASGGHPGARVHAAKVFDVEGLCCRCRGLNLVQGYIGSKVQS